MSCNHPSKDKDSVLVCMTCEAEASKASQDRIMKAIDDLRPNIMGYVMDLPNEFYLWERLRKAVLKELSQ